MKTPIVTACDENYLQGLVALHNSFLANSAEGFEFHAIIRGSDEFADHVRSLGIGVFHNLEFPARRIPDSDRFPGMAATSYLRLLVPRLFPELQKSVYIDADSIILQSLQPLVDRDFGERPVAATRSNSAQHKEFTGGTHEVGPMSSLYIFNHTWWFRKQVLERCIEVMETRSDIKLVTLSQGLLQFVLQRDWYELPWQTQAHAGHDTYSRFPRHEIHTLHFMGTNPWDEYRPDIPVTEGKLEARALWRTYA